MDKYLLLINSLDEIIKKLESKIENKRGELDREYSEYYRVDDRYAVLSEKLNEVKRNIAELNKMGDKNLFLFSLKEAMGGLFEIFKNSPLGIKLIYTLCMVAIVLNSILLPQFRVGLGFAGGASLGLLSVMTYANYKFKKNNDMSILLSDEDTLSKEYEENKQFLLGHKGRTAKLNDEIANLISEREDRKKSLEAVRASRLNALEGLLPEEEINEAFEQEIKENAVLRLILEKVEEKGE